MTIIVPMVQSQTRDQLMPRISHGETPSLERLAQAQQGTRQVNRDLKVPFEFAVIQEPSPFGYLFPELQTPETLLPTSRQIRDGLVNLGVTMVEPEDDSTPDSATPSAYTYFGQFLDHDITFEAKSDSLAGSVRASHTSSLPAARSTSLRTTSSNRIRASHLISRVIDRYATFRLRDGRYPRTMIRNRLVA